MFRDQDVYSNDINIASRIESMGIPGSILVSKKVRDVIKNQPDILLPSLGKFKFKNVEEPIEVYALANAGFAVPKINDLQGKFKEQVKTVRPNYLIYALVAGAIAISARMWLKNKNGDSLDISGSTQFEAEKTPLSEEERNKRVAVMVFENKTGDEYLEDFGTMISDWVTKGLMEMGEANVISAANIQSKIVKAGFTASDLDQFSQITGVGLILQGRFYLQEDQLIIHANIINTEKGEVIYALDPIQGPRDELINLLNELTDDFLGYWSIKAKSRFAQNPPKYEAYQKYVAANRVWVDPEYNDYIEKNLLEAIELDPNFVEAKIKYAVFNGNFDRDLWKRDSLIQLIENNNLKLSKWESLRLNAIKASAKFEWEKSAELNMKMFEMDQSDINSA